MPGLPEAWELKFLLTNMGKKRTVIIGAPELEEKQKLEAKKRAEIKKQKKTKEKESEPVAVAVEKTIESEKKPEDKKTTKKALKKSPRKRGKRYSETLKKIDKHKHYSIKEAVKLLQELSIEKFNATVELHINTFTQEPKGEVSLPHGIGKKLNIAVFDAQLEEKIKKGEFDFDILLAKPQDMKILVKYASVLGPKGLMPSPKRGTLVENIEAAKEKFNAGTIHFKTEAKFPLIHQAVGKRDFTPQQLEENILAFLRAVGKKHIKQAFIKTTMSPALKLDISQL